MNTIKVAVASTDGLTVNEHFGKARGFMIYELGDTMTYIETRTCEQLSTGDAGHAFDPSRFSRIVAGLKDCQKVYVADIGAVPEAELKSCGIEVIKCKCPIDQIGCCGCKCKST
jgi:nitrogen fixation protein NifX